MSFHGFSGSHPPTKTPQQRHFILFSYIRWMVIHSYSSFFYYVSLFKGKKIFSLRLIENKDLCKWAQYDMLDSFCCDRNDFNNCLFEYVWTLSMFMYLAFIGRVRISSPTPSTSTTSDSWYVLTVLEHSVTCTNIAQTYNKTTNTPIHRQDNKCLRLKRKESSLMSPSALKTPVSTG